MLWHAFDKGGKWLLQHHGNGALFLGGVRKVVRWRAVESELVQPGQLPDGLLEVEIEDLPPGGLLPPGNRGQGGTAPHRATRP